MKITKITHERLEELIVSSEYHRFPGTTVTICLLTLTNGFNVIGKSACIDPANFEQDIGEEVAFNHAFDQLWDLEGYHAMSTNQEA